MKTFIVKALALFLPLVLVGCSYDGLNQSLVLDSAYFSEQPILLSDSSLAASESVRSEGFLEDYLECYLECTQVKLPHQWIHSDSEAQQWHGYYVLELPAAIAALEKPTLYIPRWAQNAELVLNGQPIYARGDLGDSLSRYWNRPQLVSLPKSLLRDSDNQLAINLQTTYVGYMSRIFVNDYEVLEPLYSARLSWQIDLNEALLAMMLAMSLFLLFLWYQNPAQKSHLYAGLASAFWAIHLYGLVTEAIPLPDRMWWWLEHTAIDLVTLFLVLFCNRFRNAYQPKFERSLIGLAALASFLYLITPAGLLIGVSSVFHLGGWGVIIYIVVQQLKFAYKNSDRQQAALGFSLAIFVIFVAHDLYLHSSFGALQSERFFNLASLGAPFVLLVISWNLAVRFTDAMRQSEYLSANLQKEVDIEKRKLDDEFDAQRQQDLGAQRVSVRLGIYGYLHTEISEKLLALLHSSKTPEQETIAREAISDLGDAVRITAPENSNRIDIVLEDCFAETSRRCDEYDIPLYWNQDLPGDLPHLNASVSACLRRALREAISNVFKHAAASQVKVDIQATEKSLALKIEDNGAGFRNLNPKDTDAKAFQIPSLESRLRSVEGKLSVEALSPQGTLLCIEIPLGGDQ